MPGKGHARWGLELECRGSRRGVGSSLVPDLQLWAGQSLGLGPLLPLMPLGAHTGHFLQFSQQLVSAQLYISPRIQGAGFAPPFFRR